MSGQSGDQNDEQFPELGTRKDDRGKVKEMKSKNNKKQCPAKKEKSTKAEDDMPGVRRLR